ncbi:membrane-bound lytic murein transglycosylase MltF [Actinobacillus equuli subsp. equuli]|uniref:Membrane-bound lytic murein transglycosylase F n=2 Tax=Actinobacillus equuli TaxID=718 RepID=A0A9X4JCM2_ACTEU|nr:membrane-bound lytic murein transglycosylase MltF [Actinobacillus equuli]MDE8033988.1 membrane-bound lytic murein transglycosylase MltF [Actinobacillus equuli subsp. equuli]MDG4947386.1 membrane-bound lytic murein transglycosylase MltF [Actinobacillus equuli subsp. haemolyticus]MDG4953537.1 membrane-bound lytic murein transglycosylase MltF [Actinobacillus equuli subsp. equuli]WGE42209.1 membrane-bound lytic murein transglycosylase MltF [Actinobacillus equuli subsp. haemolyticus]WGE46558.1 m
MKGLLARLFVGMALLLWAWDMVYPWQQLMQAEENRYGQIQQRQVLKVGMINHPLSYFVGADGTAGIEYELAKSFSEYLGVGLEVKSFEHSEQLFKALKENKIDIAAAGLLYQPELGEQFQIGATYYSASWQVAYKKGKTRPYKLADLQDELVVPSGSAVLPILQKLKEEHPKLRWHTTDQFTQEELLLQVAEGKIPYTVAVSVDISAAQHISPNIAVGFDLTDEMPVLWYLPSSSYSELQAAVLDFMDNANETGLISRIEEKYFNHLSRFDYVDTQSYLNAIKSVLPKYQPLFEKYRGDLEWQMLAAIAYQESHWDPNATSPTGVRGMMMLTRDTADRMKITDRTNAEQSIRAGSEYLHLLMGQIPETVAKEDRIWFGLAAYNMGLGHLLDVRRLTKQLGGDPDNWLDVKKNLPLLAEKRHYSGLKYGYARGFEAFQYVENIRRYHSSIMNHQRVEEQKVQALQLSKQQAQESQLLEASPIAPFTDKMLTQPEQSNEVIKE